MLRGGELQASQAAGEVELAGWGRGEGGRGLIDRGRADAEHMGIDIARVWQHKVARENGGVEVEGMGGDSSGQNEGRLLPSGGGRVQ